MTRKKSTQAPAGAGPQPDGESPPRQQGKPPVHEIRIGRVRAVVWENVHATQGVWYSVIVSRSFKDNDGNWRTAHSFGRDDLLVVAELARQAFLWVAQHGNGSPIPSSEPAAAPDEIPA